VSGDGVGAHTQRGPQRERVCCRSTHATRSDLTETVARLGGKGLLFAESIWTNRQTALKIKGLEKGEGGSQPTDACVRCGGNGGVLQCLANPTPSALAQRPVSSLLTVAPRAVHMRCQHSRYGSTTRIRMLLFQRQASTWQNSATCRRCPAACFSSGQGSNTAALQENSVPSCDALRQQFWPALLYTHGPSGAPQNKSKKRPNSLTEPTCTNPHDRAHHLDTECTRLLTPAARVHATACPRVKLPPSLAAAAAAAQQTGPKRSGTCHCRLASDKPAAASTGRHVPAPADACRQRSIADVTHKHDSVVRLQHTVQI
jgi:hypothetical protein